MERLFSSPIKTHSSIARSLLKKKIPSSHSSPIRPSQRYTSIEQRSIPPKPHNTNNPANRKNQPPRHHLPPPPLHPIPHNLPIQTPRTSSALNLPIFFPRITTTPTRLFPFPSPSRNLSFQIRIDVFTVR